MKKIVLFLLPLMMMAISCQDAIEIVDPNGSDKGITVSGVLMKVPAIMFDEQTKVAMGVNETTGLSFTWEDGDQTGVYSTAGGFSLFELSAGAGLANAVFDGGGFTLAEGNTYYAMYPYDGAATDKTKIPLNYAGQSVDGDNDMDSPMDRDYMWSSAVATTGHADFTFKHIGAFLRLQISLPEGTAIDQVDLVPMYEEIPQTMDFDISADDPAPTAKTSSPVMSVTATNLTVPSGDVATVWVAMPPQSLTADHIAVLVHSGADVYAARLAGSAFNPGKAYRKTCAPLNIAGDPGYAYTADPKAQVEMSSVPAGQYSGIFYMGDNGNGTYHFAVVDDKKKEGGIVFFDIPINASGVVDGANIACNVPQISKEGADSKDNEDVVYDGSALWVAAEGDQSIRKYNAESGASESVAFTIPADMGSSFITGNAGFEALTYDPTSQKFWTTTELPLQKDDFFPRLHRLQRFDADHNPDSRFLYQMDAPTVASGDIATATSYVFGIPAMTALPDGRLIVLEREVYVPKFANMADITTVKNNSFARVKLYVVDPADNSGILRKKLLTDAIETGIQELAVYPSIAYSANLANYEGMCLGPVINGQKTLLLIADSQGGMKDQNPMSLTLTKEWIKVILF